MHVCCIAAFRCYCFTTNATYRLVQVKWFTTVIRFESEVLPHCSCHVRLWIQFLLCFYSVKCRLALPLACYSSQGSHAALCVMSGTGSRLPTQRMTDKRVCVWDKRKKKNQACKWKISRLAKLSSSFLFIVWLIDLLSWHAYCYIRVLFFSNMLKSSSF